MFRLLLGALSFAALTLAQCDNYGTQSSSSANCTCPIGVGGPTCADPTCGGTIYDGLNRPLALPVGGATYGNQSSCTCPNGWGGVGCNVCQSSSACNSAYTSVFGNTVPNLNDPLSASETQNTTITCSTQPRVWAVGQLSCGVQNPTLAALFPGQSTLNILRNLNPANTLAGNVSSFGPAGYVHAQLWYQGEEQFFCQADNCIQTDGDNQLSDWNCKNLKCVCRPGSTFCSGLTSIDGIINQLTGDLEIKCLIADDGTQQCSFLQQKINQVFGNNGLRMDPCTFGECVRQSVIDTALQSQNTTTVASDKNTELSGGVVAGLGVVGGLILIGILTFIWGFLAQRSARRGDKSALQKQNVAVQWSAINYSIPSSSTKSFFRKRDDTGDKYILHDLSGAISPGEMLAILGPSGAGKTSLIEILGGKSKAGKLTGSVVFTTSSGERVKKPRIGYVDQADILPSMLTVQEALTFAANLRLPESVTQEEKNARVFEVMNQLGIVDIKDTRIGSHERRGISGGEQRRVSIGLELVASPDILVLDEPTSGLDSVSAATVVTVLRDLSHDPTNPTAILASIHQPNSKLYQLFDKVLVLSHGREIYFGPGGLAPNDYFAQRGKPAQPGYNVADHLLDIASEPTSDLIQPQKRPLPPSRASANSTVDENKQSENARLDLSSIPPSDVEVNEKTTAPRSIRSASAQYSATFLTQLQVLSGREWKILKRDRSLFIMHIGVAAILGVFCGGLYFKTGTTIAGFQSRVGCLFFLGSLLSFSALSALYNLIEIRPLFLRERSGSYYSPTAWLLSRFFFDVLPLRIVPTIVVSTIVYWMAGLSPDAGRFFKFVFILILYTFGMTLFNFLLACTFRNGGIAILLSALFNLFIMTYAGFFVHLNDIPPVLRWLQWFSLLKYCLEALSVNEVGAGLMIQDSLEGVPVNVSAQLIMNLLFGFGADNYYRDVLVLFAYIAGFGLALIAVVWKFVREQR